MKFFLVIRNTGCDVLTFSQPALLYRHGNSKGNYNTFVDRHIFGIGKAQTSDLRLHGSDR